MTQHQLTLESVARLKPSSRWPARLGAALLVFTLFALALCAGNMHSVNPARITEPGLHQKNLRVLAIGEPDWPLMQKVGPFLASAEFRSIGLPPVVVDAMRHESKDQVVHDLKERLKRGDIYDAILVSSVSTARLVQLREPIAPIVFEGVDNAKSLCLVNSLRQPGKNATGYMHVLAELEGRMMQVLQDAFTGLAEIVVLVSGANYLTQGCADEASPSMTNHTKTCQHGRHAAHSESIAHRIESSDLLAFASRLQLKLTFFVVCDIADVLRLRGRLAANSGVLVPWHDLFVDSEAELVKALAQLRVPVIGSRHEFAVAGGLMALSVSAPPAPRESLRLLSQVLAGQHPSTLPVSTPAAMRLTLNATTAKQQGLRPALAVWRRADEVVQ